MDDHRDVTDFVFDVENFRDEVLRKSSCILALTHRWNADQTRYAYVQLPSLLLSI